MRHVLSRGLHSLTRTTRDAFGKTAFWAGPQGRGPELIDWGARSRTAFRINRHKRTRQCRRPFCCETKTACWTCRRDLAVCQCLAGIFSSNQRTLLPEDALNTFWASTLMIVWQAGVASVFSIVSRFILELLENGGWSSQKGDVIIGRGTTHRESPNTKLQFGKATVFIYRQSGGICFRRRHTHLSTVTTFKFLENGTYYCFKRQWLLNHTAPVSNRSDSRYQWSLKSVVQ